MFAGALKDSTAVDVK